MMIGFCFTCSWRAPRDSSMLLSMSRMLLMHRVLNKELNNDVIDLQRENDTTKLKSVRWESYFSERQKMLRIFPAKPTAPKMIMKTPTIQNLSGEKKLFVQKTVLKVHNGKSWHSTICKSHYIMQDLSFPFSRIIPLQDDTNVCEVLTHSANWCMFLIV